MQIFLLLFMLPVGLPLLALGLEHWRWIRQRRQAKVEIPGVEGAQIHVCRRHLEKAPVVFVLETGLARVPAQMDWLLRLGDEGYGVLLYDRPGTGWSDPCTDSDVEANSQILNGVLDRLGVRVPVIMVGYSVGALYARTFAACFPERVRAMALLDPVLPGDQGAGGGRWGRILGRYERHLRLKAWGARLGLLRRPFTRGADRQDPALLSGHHWSGAAAEARRLPRAREKVARIPLTASLPLQVISASLPAEPWRREWNGMHASLAVAAGGHHLICTDADHTSLVDDTRHQERILQALKDLAERAGQDTVSETGELH